MPELPLQTTPLTTGDDSGIGRAVGIGFAKEGADAGIVFLHSQKDAASTRRRVEALGHRYFTIAARHFFS